MRVRLFQNVFADRKLGRKLMRFVEDFNVQPHGKEPRQQLYFSSYRQGPIHWSVWKELLNENKNLTWGHTVCQKWGKMPQWEEKQVPVNNAALAGNPSFEVRRRGCSITACNLVSRWSQARSPRWLGNAPLSDWARPPDLQGLEDANKSHSGLRFCQSEDCPILSASSPLLIKTRKPEFI